ncbi:AMP-binding protein [Chryseobacterium wangxinyae]|uniref:AMP-binding protein n=1 Tax=Chryseobacterium sp. CY350 TaxID=2997336 RepID=UPI002270671D|nr:AMP-binding protein [Chryseobacterium sp. CY350]MCY0976804.1 AMP-binding protein [Chryseobacterium sp. CY350]WBZ96805.1 AMP-binding protein [Chryseobacterium sp. CY350]
MNISSNIIKNLLLHNNKNQILYDLNSISGEEIAKEIITLATFFRSTTKFSNGDRVILSMNDSPEFIYSFIALISIGCIPVPLNPLIQESELEYILKDSKATGVIIDNHQYLRLYQVIHSSSYIINDCVLVNNPSVKEYGSINYLQKYLSSKKAFNTSLISEFVYAENNPVAFWQYTSGTTGNPKAVQHGHYTMLTNTELFAQKTLGIGEDDVIISVPKMFFGYGLGNSLFFPLLSGATVIIDEKWFSLDNLKKNIRLYKPTVIFGTPKIYSDILHNYESFSENDFSSVRLFVSAGSSLQHSIIKEWKSKFDKTIVNGIGSTEIGHIFMCSNQVKENDENSSLGIPVTGYQIKICEIDKPDSVVENHEEIGELCIFPPEKTLSSYWQQENTNTAKYKNGWYFSGDLCSKKEDGTYVYHGRKDELFKVNGRWVNPLEIENTVLQNFHEVRECAVTYFIDDDGLEKPILYIVRKTDINKDLLSDDIQKKLAENFSSYKLPTRTHFLNTLPRNSNGKVIKKGLENNLTEA